MSPAIRADAVRSRERILDAARAQDVADLRLNDVARTAGVGVGTVYRHFPTVLALIEALSLDALSRLCDAAESAAADPGPARGLRDFLRAALCLQLEDRGLQTVLTELSAGDPGIHGECTVARARVHGGYATVLARAQDAGAVRTDLTPGQLQRLVCGVEHAVRLGSPADRDILLDVLLAGIRPAS